MNGRLGMATRGSIVDLYSQTSFERKSHCAHRLEHRRGLGSAEHVGFVLRMVDNEFLPDI